MQERAAARSLRKQANVAVYCVKEVKCEEDLTKDESISPARACSHDEIVVKMSPLKCKNDKELESIRVIDG